MLHNIRSLQSALSESELACIGGTPETLVRAITRESQSSREEQAGLIACLENKTMGGVFLAGLVSEPEPLSLETSDASYPH